MISATKEYAKILEKEGYKFDTKSTYNSVLEQTLMKNKSTIESLGSFQKSVLLNATKSKAKNLELIKSWSSSESLEYTSLYEELAEVLVKYGKR